QAYFDHVAQAVTGVARLKLYKGNVQVVGRKAPRSLYLKDLVSFDELGGYHQKDAEGFIKINALRLRVRAMVGGSPLEGEGKGHGA
ncbi:MAG: argininosuccinate synthase, partial [Thermus sp.]